MPHVQRSTKGGRVATRAGLHGGGGLNWLGFINPSVIRSRSLHPVRGVRGTPQYLLDDKRINPEKFDTGFVGGVTLILTPIIANCVSARHCRES